MSCYTWTRRWWATVLQRQVWHVRSVVVVVVHWHCCQLAAESRAGLLQLQVLIDELVLFEIRIPTGLDIMLNILLNGRYLMMTETIAQLKTMDVACMALLWRPKRLYISGLNTFLFWPSSEDGNYTVSWLPKLQRVSYRISKFIKRCSQ